MANEKDFTEKTNTPDQNPDPKKDHNDAEHESGNNLDEQKRKKGKESEKTGEEMPEGQVTKPSLFERLHDLLSKVRRFVHHILHPQPDSQIIPKRRRPFERRHASGPEQDEKEQKDGQKKEDQEKDVNSKKESKEKGSKESAERKGRESDRGNGDEVSRMQAKAKSPRRPLRDYGNLFYHIIARIGLGREGYMHAVQEAERREAEAQKEANEKPDVKETASESKTEKNAQGGPTDKQETEKSQPDQEQKNPEPEKPLKHLYEVFTKDTAESNKFLVNYEKRLAEHLKAIGHKEVDIHAVREDGMITFQIAYEKDGGGTKNTFMNASDIHVTMDSNYNIVEAMAVGEQGPFDVTETLGKYIAADMAGNFREDYNRYDDVHNVLSENRFTDFVQTETANSFIVGEDGKPVMSCIRETFDPIRVDNVLYEVTSSKAKDGISRMLTFTPIEKGGKPFTVPAKEWLENQEIPRERLEAAQNRTTACNEYQKKCEEYNALAQELKTDRAELAKGRAQEGQMAQDDPNLQQVIKKNKVLNFTCKHKSEQMQQLQAELAKNIKSQFGKTFETSDVKQIQAFLDQSVQEETARVEELKAECQKLPPHEELEQTVKEAFKAARAAHLENVTRERQEIRHLFDDVLPTAKDGPFYWHLNDLEMAAADPDKTLQEILEPEQEQETNEQEQAEQEKSQEEQEKETDEQEKE